MNTTGHESSPKAWDYGLNASQESILKTLVFTISGLPSASSLIIPPPKIENSAVDASLDSPPSIASDRLPPPYEASSLKAILSPIQGDMEETDEIIRSRLSSDVALIGTIADYIISAGGKRLRPAVVLLTARALGYKGKNHHALAAVIEFIHTATLLHDDVVDDSSLRRGRTTSNAMFGNAASVLVGDFLYSRAFQMMVACGSGEALSILADATNRIAEGEVLQLMNIHDPSIDEARYHHVVDRKTATLFSAAARIGAILANADLSLQKTCSEYGAHVGAAFQMIDDALDYAGNIADIGKQLGDDLREGKCTLPLIRALEVGTASQKQEIQKAIEDGSGDFAKIAAIVRDTGALNHVRARAQAEVNLAKQAALTLPPSEFRQSLLDLASFALHRDR